MIDENFIWWTSFTFVLLVIGSTLNKLFRQRLQTVLTPRELLSLLRFRLEQNRRSVELDKIARSTDDLGFSTVDSEFCQSILSGVSRSFALVIQTMEDNLRQRIAVFYLILRQLDSIEDETCLSVDDKVRLLKEFPRSIFGRDLPFTEQTIGQDRFERALNRNFEFVVRLFQRFDVDTQTIIGRIVEQMSSRMIQFIERKQTIDTLEQYDDYCYSVASLVGHGLTQLFVSSKDEDPSIIEQEKFINSMGLFLQKTNIIRDYLEDIKDKRCWWPRQIWSKHFDRLEFAMENPRDPNSVRCLNEMIENNLEHLPDVIEFLRLIRTESIFRFCAIPQLMALATLSILYGDHSIFIRSNVKIGKQLTWKIFKRSSTMEHFYSWTRIFLGRIEARQSTSDTSLRAIIQRTRRLIDQSS